MKRYLLILVFALPIAGLGLTSFLAPEGGKKKKKKKEQTTQETAQEAKELVTDLNMAEEEMIEEEAEETQVAQRTDNDVEVIVEEGDLWEEWGTEQETEADFYHSRQEVNNTVSKVIDQQLVDRIAEAKGVEVNAFSFSRCPSGVDFVVLQKPSGADEYYHGLVNHNRGCSSEIQCKFRLNANTLQIGVSTARVGSEIWRTKNLYIPGEKFVSVDAWMANYFEQS